MLRQTSVRIEDTDLKKLDALAKKDGLKGSDLIRRAVREYLNKK
jgi:metal-responsive CopG/Arc/MetJ family transcriptional regulator